MRLYGIPNCSTVKKARSWLAGRSIDIPFHDFRKDGLDPVVLEDWVARIGWQDLVNRKGTTWRQLGDAEKAAVDSSAAAMRLMLEKPAVIRRPVLDTGKELVLGFEEARYADIFGK